MMGHQTGNPFDTALDTVLLAVLAGTPVLIALQYYIGRLFRRHRKEHHHEHPE